ncbi:hypothetical protein SZ51_06965 [Brachyspira hyodysenteriae]|uniref:hypothetical protein n=1 Tax=Brachyspira hyodysenteriae TaxID=159 RepID=UPI00063DB7C6|nr:hypothetical protein [Brachyspira hyodysenteriae]KLI38472.1 hypothetical protein SZ51_06965 [Brachyspira hyodysenteriae]
MLDKDKLLIVDEQTKFSMERNPVKTSAVKGHFQVCELGSEELKNIYVKTLFDKPYPLINKKGYFVESKLYENVFYPLESFNECYERDLSSIITQIAFYMGAQSVSIISDTKETKVSENSKSFKANIDANILGYEGNANFNRKKNESADSKIKKSFKFNANIKGKSCLSKEDFKKWIEDEKINLYAVNFMQAHINSFLIDGYLEANLDKEEFSLEYSKNVHEEYTSIKAAFDANIVPDYIKVGLNIDFNKNGISERKWAKYFNVHIEF